MSEHLASDQFERYQARTMAPAELLAADDHLARCEDCRLLVSGEAEQTAFSFLRGGLRADAGAETHHLLYEQLEAYVDGSADDVESEVIESHLGMCRSCGTEVDDLRALGAEKAHPEMKNLSAKAPSLGERFLALWHRPAYGISLMILAAAVIVLLVGWIVLLPFMRQVDNLRAQVQALEEANGALQQQASTVAALQDQVAQLQQSQVQGADSSSLIAVALNDGGGLLTLDKQGNLTGLRLSSSLRQRIARTLTGGLQGVPDLRELSGNTGTLLAGGSEAVPFALISPVGVVTETNRPSFRWRQLGGTATYTVRLFDSSFNKVMTSSQLTATRWTSSTSLERGRVYVWQVVAQKDGKEIISPVPPAPEAKFRVLEQERAEELAQAKRDYPTSHLVLGTLFAQAGLLDEAEREYKALATANPNSPIARRLLDSVRALRTSR